MKIQAHQMSVASMLLSTTAFCLLCSNAQGVELTTPKFTDEGIIIPATQHPVYEDKSRGVRINAGTLLEGGVLGTHDINYGASGHDNGLNAHKSPAWWEAAIVPALTAEYDIPEGGTLFTGIDGSYNMTRGNGDGDPTGTTADHPEHAHLDKAYLGWKSGSLFADSLGQNALAFSFGRQAYQFGDGFLIGDGFNNPGKYASYWMDPSLAFHSTAIMSLNSHGWHADLFHLKASQFEPTGGGSNAGHLVNTSLNGVNVDYILSDRAEFGGAYLHVYNTTGDSNSSRDGMDVYNLRAKGTPLESLPEVGLAGQYVLEHYKHQSYDTAHAWFAQADYTFKRSRWTPTIAYRRAQYSNNYDSLFNSFAGGWGTWFYGEIAGEYQIANSNINIDMLEASFQPVGWVNAGIIGYHFHIPDHSNSIRSGTFSNEVNVFADWTVTPRLSISTVYGIAFPGQAAKASYGSKTAQIAEAWVMYNF